MTAQDREDFVLMKSDIEHTKETVEKIEVKQEKFNKDFDKLMFHLVGDKDTNTKGWIERLSKFDFRLTLIERAYAIGVGLTVALFFLKDKIL